jgi:hypothetical protein
MNRCQGERRELGVQEPAALARDPELTAEKRLRRCRAQADESGRLHDPQLGVEPGAARGDLARVRLLMDPPLPARLPFEVLHGIRDVGRGAVDPGLDERLVEKASGGADERPALQILTVARLLADEQDFGALQPLAEHRLRSGQVERAGGAPAGGLAQRTQAEPLR